jgi:hypothetical protein
VDVVEQEPRGGRSPAVAATAGVARHARSRRRAPARMSLPSAALTSAAVVAGAVYLTVPPSTVRAVVTLTFLLLCPGLAVVRLLRLPSRLVGLTLAIGLSLVLDQATAMVSMYAGVWSPGGCLAVLALLTATAAHVPHLREVLGSGGGAHVSLAR